MKELATNPKSIYLLLALYSVYDNKKSETESKCTQHMQLNQTQTDVVGLIWNTNYGTLPFWRRCR